jgi:hypothetical protein
MARASLPTLNVTAQPKTTDGSTAPTAWANALTEDYYDLANGSGFTAFCTVHTTPTGTTPTLDLKLQHSPDGTNWDDLDGSAFTQITTATTESVSVPGPGTSDAKTFARYVRIVEQFNNADNVFSYTIKIAQLE